MPKLSNKKTKDFIETLRDLNVDRAHVWYRINRTYKSGNNSGAKRLKLYIHLFQNLGLSGMIKFAAEATNEEWELMALTSSLG